MENVIWRPVNGYENYYEVSNTGEVKSLERIDENNHLWKERILAKQKTDKGYERVILSRNGKVKAFFVHRLVALAFPEICGVFFEGAECNHRNEAKNDNRAENLEWCNRLYNANYGTGKQRNAEHRINHPDISKEVKQYALDGTFIAEHPSISEAHRQTGVDIGHISDCILGKRKTAGGYAWK